MGSEEPTLYAFFSHETAVEAIWHLAHRKWAGVLDDEDVWLISAPESCVKTQGEYAQLAKEVDLSVLGITREPVDLLVPNKACYSRGKRARFHVWADFFPPHSFVRLHNRVLVSSPYFAVLQLAAAKRADRLSCQEAKESAEEDARVRKDLGIDESPATPQQLVRWGNISRFVRATQVLCDFSGTYRLVPGADAVFQTKPLMSPGSFRNYLSQMPASKGIMRSRDVANSAFGMSASPMETMLALMLTLPVSMGGFGLPRPELNRHIDVEPGVRDLSSKEEFYGDLCWWEERVLVEFYGWKDHFGAGPAKVAEDAARANSLAALGWTVLHVTYEQVKTIEGLSLLARQVAHALQVELQAPNDLERIWRSRLLAQLLPSVEVGDA